MKGDVNMKRNLCSKGHKAKYVLFWDERTFGAVVATFFSSKKTALKHMESCWWSGQSLHDSTGKMIAYGEKGLVTIV